MADGCYGNSEAPAGRKQIAVRAKGGEEGSQGPSVRVQTGPAESSWSRTDWGCAVL